MHTEAIKYEIVTHNLTHSRCPEDTVEKPRVPTLTFPRVQGGKLIMQQGKRICPTSQGELVSTANKSLFDAVSLMDSLKACAQLKDLSTGRRIHAYISKRSSIRKNIYVGTVLVHMYARCGAIVEAQRVFDELKARNVVSWSALIAGYVQKDNASEALNCYERMRREGISPNAVTYTCILKACGRLRAAEKGEEIHCEVVKQKLLEDNAILGCALVDMYAKCGMLVKAQQVLDKLPLQNVVTWSSMITAYTQYGHGHEAIKCFKKMQYNGLPPDPIVFSAVLKACGSIQAAQEGKQIHAEVVRQGLLAKDTVLGTALVDMYLKCGALAKAQEVFDELPTRDSVSWNAIISAHSQYEHYHEAIEYFQQMQCEGFSPNTITFICTLKACGSLGASQKGEDLHADIVGRSLLGNQFIVGNALVEMYVKCGRMGRAQKVFDQLLIRSAVCWSNLIIGYAQIGQMDAMFPLLKKMVVECQELDEVTLSILLTACSHTGLVEEGEKLFENISKSYGIIPTLENWACIVDLFGRAGHLQKALGVIENLLPCDSDDYCPLWAAMLGSCKKWGNIKLGRLAFGHLVELDRKNAASYICIKNIYVAAGMLGEADKSEAMRVESNAWESRDAHSLFVDNMLLFNQNWLGCNGIH